MSDYIERDLGDIPISIGTSLAFQGLLGTHPNPPTIPPAAKRIERIMVNLRTIVRNFWSSIPTGETKRLTSTYAIEEIYKDISVIRNVIPEMFRGKVDVVFYYSRHDELKWRFPKASFREPKTEKQILEHSFIEKYTEAIVAHLIDEDPMSVMMIRKEPLLYNKVVALLTHYPHELLWRSQFEILHLLESHTGKAKGYDLWYSKLKLPKGTPPVPFNEFTLQFFGDGTMFDAAADNKMKKELITIIESRKWSILTTRDKIVSNIRDFGSKELFDMYYDLTSRSG